MPIPYPFAGPLVAEVFAPFVEAGFMRMAYGGAEAGAYLAQHPGIDEIHITGSARTHDAIVFGAGPEGAARKARGDVSLRKRVTSELGGVCPLAARIAGARAVLPRLRGASPRGA